MTMPKTLPISDVPLFLGTLSLHLLNEGEPVELTRYGKKLGTIVSGGTPSLDSYQPPGVEAKLVKARELMISAVAEATEEQALQISEILDMLDTKLRALKLLGPVQPANIPG